ncbi:hypothetical protein [Spirosoma radiotolerans]|uniref:hypothetical protein n=1 Tax=Spirosoma radiotolerans TaxID=1379870 RepID=UPI00130E976A|nr:hypothetical protein [Spirosoma radiotolerans]
MRRHVTVNYLNYPFKLALFVEDDNTFSPEARAIKNLLLAIAGTRSTFGDSGLYL